MYHAGGEGEEGVSDEVESLIEALAYAQTRARKAEALVEDYDLRIQAAVLKAFHWVQNAKNELSNAQKEKQAIEKELEGLRKRRNELRQQESFSEALSWGSDGEELGSVWETSFVVVDDYDEREKEDENYSSSINALSSQLIQSARQLQQWQREYEARSSLLNQLEVFIGPLMFWRNKTRVLAPHVHQKLTVLMNEMEHTHGSHIFENVAIRLLEMHQTRRGVVGEVGTDAEEESSSVSKGKEKEKVDHDEALVVLQQQLQEMQERFSETEGRNEHLESELSKLNNMLKEEQERRLAAEHRLRELEDLLMSGQSHGSRNHDVVLASGDRRETLLQCYASTGGLERVKLLDDSLAIAGVHSAVDAVFDWFVRTLHRCENIVVLASRLWANDI